MKIDVAIINAFTINGSGGNPAGVVLDADNLSTEQMQEVARQVGASETVFVLKDDTSTCRFRFFTPTVEVGLCGHATIAAWALMQHKGMYKEGEYTQANLDDTVDIEVGKEGKVFMQQPVQTSRENVPVQSVVSALNIKEDDLDMTLPPQMMQKQLMIALKSEETLNALQPDLGQIIEISKQYDFFGFHVFALSDDAETTAYVRNFCPVVGINEDAATGTANGSFLSYLRSKDMLAEQPIFKVEQGKAMGRHSQLYGMFKNDRVWIGGEATVQKQKSIEV